MSARNYSAWIQGIRDSWADGRANINRMGPWEGARWRLEFGPSRTFFVSWPHFYRPGPLHLVKAETYTETQVEDINYVDPGVTDSTTTRQWDSLLSVDQAVPRQWVYHMAAPEDETELPPFYALKVHSSATPYGEGLYDAEGTIRIVAPTLTENHYSNTAAPGTDFDTIATVNESYNFYYRSDSAGIIGLLTPCRITLTQTFHGPALAFRPQYTITYDEAGSSVNDIYTNTDVPFNPQELDPDGVPGAAVEMYVEETALAALVAGSVSMDMVRLSGAEARAHGPHDDGIDSLTFSWSHDWLRSGNITLTLN